MKILSSIMIAPKGVAGCVHAFTVPLGQPMPIIGYPDGAPAEVEAMIKELALKVIDSAFYKANLLLMPSLCTTLKAGELGTCLGSVLAQSLSVDYIGEEADIEKAKKTVTAWFKVASKTMHAATPLGQFPIAFKPLIPIHYQDTVEVDVCTDPDALIVLEKPLIVRFTLDGFGLGPEEEPGQSCICKHCGGNGYLVAGKKSKARRVR